MTSRLTKLDYETVKRAIHTNRSHVLQLHISKLNFATVSNHIYTSPVHKKLEGQTQIDVIKKLQSSFDILQSHGQVEHCFTLENREMTNQAVQSEILTTELSASESKTVKQAKEDPGTGPEQTHHRTKSTGTRPVIASRTKKREPNVVFLGRDHITVQFD